VSANPNGDEEESRTLIRVINRASDEYLVYALVAESVDFAALGLSYNTEVRIRLHKKTGELICTTNAVGAIDMFTENATLTNEIRPYWGQYKCIYINADLSQMILDALDALKAVPLRHMGGVYFVPIDGQATLETLRTIVATLPRTNGHEPYLCALGVPDVQEARTQLMQVVHSAILDEVAAMEGDLARLETSDSETREKTILGRLERYRQIKEKAQTYADLLEMRQDAIQEAVTRLQSRAMNLLS
jgi:hypothetical protein